MRLLHLVGLTIALAAILSAPFVYAATLGDAANKTTLGNDVIGGSQFIYSLGGLSVSTTTTSTGAIILGTGGLRFSDGSTQLTSAQTTANFWALSGNNLYPTSTAYKVAIGSAVATSSLTVIGDAILYGASGNISAGVYYDRTNSTYYLDPGANENAYSLITAGNVGIATGTAPHALTVNGNILAQGANVLFGDISTSNREYISSFDSGITGINTVGVFGFYADGALGAAATAPSAGISANGIYSSGAVGISTTTPVGKLTVFDSGGLNPTMAVRTSNTSQTILRLDNTTTRNYELAVGGSSNPTVGAFYIYDTTAGARRLTINTSGDISVGQDTAAEKLDVNGNIRASRLRLGGATFSSGEDLRLGGIRGRFASALAGTSELIHLFNNVNIGYPSGWGSQDAPQYGLSVYGGAFLATNQGNVGIGTTNPGYKLDVNGAINASSTGGLCIAGDCKTSWTQVAAQGYWALSGNNLYPTSTAYKAVIGGTVATSSLSVIGDATLYGASGNISAGVYYDRTNTAYYLDPGANENAYSLTVAGSVGIGTTSPGAKLSVTGDVRIGNVDGESGYAVLWRGRSDLGIDEDNYSLVMSAPEGVRINLDSNANGTGTNFEIGRDVATKTGGTVLFTVRESDGSVGIGTTSPGELLDVNGGIVVRGTGGTNRGIRRDNAAWSTDIMGGASSTDGAFISVSGKDRGGTGLGGYISALIGGSNISTTSTNSYFSLSRTNTGGTAELLRVTQGGNLGIATTTPAYPLTVNGVIASVSGGFRFPDGTTQTTSAVGGGGYWALSGNNLYPTSTAYKAVIGGTVATSSLSVIGDATLYGASGNISAGVYYDRTNTAYYLDPGANENAYSLTVAGSVGIGTTGPGRTLDARGSIVLADADVSANSYYGASGDNGIIATTGTGNSALALFNTNASFANSVLEVGAVRTSNSAYWLLRAWQGNGSTSGFGTQVFGIRGDGNVGIATTTPNHKLAIDGAYYSKMVQRGNVSGSVTIDWNSGNTQHLILTGNITTLTLNNGQSGGRYTLVIKQGGTGGYEITWPASTRFSGPNPSLSNAVGDTDYVGFIYNGVDAIYDGVAVNLGF